MPSDTRASLGDDDGIVGFWPLQGEVNGNEQRFFGRNQHTERDAGTAASELLSSPPSNNYDAFRREAPSHAFPTVYPPQCSEDPFPCRFGDTSSFKARVGRRSLEGGQLQQNTKHDLPSLVAAFEKLDIGGEEHGYTGDDENEDKSRVSGSQGSGSASLFITQPLCAPLDSLIRRKDHRQQTIPYLARIASSSRLPPADTPLNEYLCAEERERSSADPQQSQSVQTESPTEIGSADTASPYASPSDSEDSLPSLSYSSSSSTASDDGRSQGSPVFSFCEQDFLSPLLPYSDLLPHIPFSPFDNTKL